MRFGRVSDRLELVRARTIRFVKVSSSVVRKFRWSGVKLCLPQTFSAIKFTFVYCSKVVQSENAWRDLYLEIRQLGYARDATLGA